MKFAALGRTHWLRDSIRAVAARGHEPVLIATADAMPEYQCDARDFKALADAVDAEGTFVGLNAVAGERVGSAVRNRFTEKVSEGRIQETLRSGPSGALGTITGVRVLNNTHFGA